GAVWLSAICAARRAECQGRFDLGVTARRAARAGATCSFALFLLIFPLALARRAWAVCATRSGFWSGLTFC
ncbi:hypothetical protein A2U01_0067613, partial [Trifolium medium]|nr:hypothetical protein [Trifolium medium]